MQNITSAAPRQASIAQLRFVQPGIVFDNVAEVWPIRFPPTSQPFFVLRLEGTEGTGLAVVPATRIAKFRAVQQRIAETYGAWLSIDAAESSPAAWSKIVAEALRTPNDDVSKRVRELLKQCAR